MKPFEGQLALATGASRGIGAATALALAEAGAHVVLTGRDTKRLEAVEQAIFDKGGHATIAPVDLAEADGIARLAAAISGRWQQLDIMVLSAAVLPQLTSVTDIDQKSFSQALTTNVLATQALLAHFHTLLKASSDARVIGLTSSVGSAPRAFWGAYAASKSAFETLLDCYAQETAKVAKIRVAIVDPGATRTEMRARAYPGEDPASVKPPEAVAARLVNLLGEQFASPHRERVNP
jgi:NAD(P)-dependent dehydrogenase (short-subunit alcohol dehydrogenase family)